MSVRVIANELGVSPSTVSLALRDNPKISARTRKKVWLAANRIDYRPNAKVNELMTHVRLSCNESNHACLGVVSLQGTRRPWERSRHMQLVYKSMCQRAAELGYRLESFSLDECGMRPARFRSILDARGIQGLLCLGDSGLELTLPEELDEFAVVTVGKSLISPVHRIVADSFNDVSGVLERIHALGYRRPGLVLGSKLSKSCARLCSGAFLSWAELLEDEIERVPVLRYDKSNTGLLLSWYERSRPDVLVCIQSSEEILELKRSLTAYGYSIPADTGIVAVSETLEGTGITGVQQDQITLGEWAIELLVSRIVDREFSLPRSPKTELVEGKWIEGMTLTKRA
ncbi:LacI family DNA-binding transcriptional regulator [Pelagicoccus mobilis]|uniref:LacI family DNA-binding transcriptional regulator n=1 Tax=Pelagicoccus mobilis TaxID=415221 RepID=A0A934RXF8_9BACT|nr:LacI family DNA-binding transcriptional regulator [Pelagicoccus mobilis]MBK1878336.1 LacI family DNA-binding transcriptional regulator [Pelagicoccus mobilis]